MKTEIKEGNQTDVERIRDVEKTKIRLILSVLFFAGFIAAALLFRLKSEDADISDARQVKAEVVGFREVHIDKHIDYLVDVEYRGKTYRLQNVLQPYLYQNPYYKSVDAYFWNGKMYANIQGVRTDNSFFRVYLFFLAAAFCTISWMIMEVSFFRRYKRLRRQEENSPFYYSYNAGTDIHASEFPESRGAEKHLWGESADLFDRKGAGRNIAILTAVAGLAMMVLIPLLPGTNNLRTLLTVVLIASGLLLCFWELRQKNLGNTFKMGTLFALYGFWRFLLSDMRLTTCRGY